MICQTRKHWRFIRSTVLLHSNGSVMWPGPHGECYAIDENTTDKPAWLAGMADEDIYLITMPGFGCTLWEGKAIEQSRGERLVETASSENYPYNYYFKEDD